VARNQRHQPAAGALMRSAKANARLPHLLTLHRILRQLQRLLP
jgi:hypothetical protein